MFSLFDNIITRKALLVERGEISYCCQSVEISLFFNLCFFLQDLAICVNLLKTVNIQFLPQESCISWDVKDRAVRIPQNTSASFITESSWRTQPWELVRSLSFETVFFPTTHIITHSFKQLYLVNTIAFHPGSKSYRLTVQVAYMTLLGKWLFSVTHSSKRTTFQSGYGGFASMRVRPCHLNDFAPTFHQIWGVNSQRW